MKDSPAREAPLAAVLFDQLARIAAGRKATVAAVFRNQHQQIGTGGRAGPGDRHGDIANNMTKLRARGALRREAVGEGADLVVPADVDDRALEDRVDREAIDHRLDLAVVERAAIAREEIVDRGTIFEVAFAHSLSPSPGFSGPSPRLCRLHIPRGLWRCRRRSLRQASAALVLCTRSNAATGRPASRQLGSNIASPPRFAVR